MFKICSPYIFPHAGCPPKKVYKYRKKEEAQNKKLNEQHRG
jgi:hypothetical protein